MSIEILLLAVLVGITLLAYMIALNSHGPTKLSISYLIATLILAGTVWAIVQYVNSGLDKKQMEEFRRLELEKKMAEERIASQEQTILENKKRTNFATKLNNIINQGTGLATAMMNVDLRDFSTELDVLVGRAHATKRSADELLQEFEKIKNEESYFAESISLIGESINQIITAAKYYSIYFRSEDSAQEEVRERMMRQEARKAYEQLKKAGSLIASNS